MQKAILLVNNDFISAQRNLDLEIESILNAQKGTLQPQNESPTRPQIWSKNVIQKKGKMSDRHIIRMPMKK
jgi:hypothetical protein